MPTTARYAIGELATLGGVSRRTVRYYVQEGLIPPPIGAGRGSHYTSQHLEQLLRVKALQEAGRTLDEIRRALASDRDTARRQAPEEVSPPRSLWRRLVLAPGVELHVAGALRLPPPSRLRELAEWCRLHFTDGRHAADKGSEDHHD